MAKYCYDYPRPAVTVDIAVLQWRQDRLNVLLIQRGHEPFAGQWALPGGFVDIDEPLDSAARRELREETGLSDVPLKQLALVGTPGRDPRGRTISAVYYAIVSAGHTVNLQHGDDASAAQWFDPRALPALAFDHTDVLAMVMDRLRRQVLYFLEGLDFFDEFTIPQMQHLHQTILNQPVSPETLRNRLQEWGLLQEARKTPGTLQSGEEILYTVNHKRLSQIRDQDLLAPLHLR
jgi:8-oxo-dGTP diphosphatase